MVTKMMFHKLIEYISVNLPEHYENINSCTHNFSLGHALWPYPVNQYSSSVRVSTGKEGGLPFFKLGN